MANMIELDLRPDERTLRQFGFIALGGFGFVAAIAWYEVLVFSFGLGAAREPVAYGLAGAATLSLLFSLAYPKANLPIYLGITILTYPIGFVLSYVILGTLFYLIIAPIGLVMRAFGADPMERRILPEADSYWEDAPPARGRASYFKQF
jgi:hypothetical protein